MTAFTGDPVFEPVGARSGFSRQFLQCQEWLWNVTAVAELWLASFLQALLIMFIPPGQGVR
jgi:hypothetical protein